MSTLHTVNKSPFERSTLDSCLKHLKAGDAVLLIEDAVLGVRNASAAAGRIAAAMRDCPIYVLGPDLAARGIKPDQLIGGVELVDYAGFVDLAVRHRRVQAWL